MKSNQTFRDTPPAGLLAGLLALLVLAVYWPAASFDFVQWDDPMHLSANPLMHPPSWAHIAVFWQQSYYQLYVPVTYTLWSLFGMVARVQSASGTMEFNPYLFHSLNIAVHIVVVLLVWRIVYRLVGNTWAAWMGAAVFALHPMSVEPVAWVSGFRDLLGACFGFAALLAYFPADRDAPRRGGARYALASILFLLAILSKPAAVAVLPMALALDLLWFGRSGRAIAIRLIPWLVAAAVLAWMTHRIQGLPPAADVPPWWQRPLVAGDAITFYLGKILLPIRLCVQYNHSPRSVLAGRMVVATTLIALGVAVALYLLGRRYRWIWLSAALFLAGLLPVLGFEPFIFQYFSTTADRYLYIAMLSVAVAVGFILMQWPRAILYGAACVWLAILGVLSFHQVLTWRSTETLFQHVLKINPHSSLALVKLSREKLREGDAPAAERLARQALEARPDDSRAWINLGAALENLHHPQEARNCYLHVIQTDSSRDSAPAYSNLAAMRADAGDYLGAIKLYHQALARDPDLVEAQIGLTEAERRLGR